MTEVEALIAIKEAIDAGFLSVALVLTGMTLINFASSFRK